MVSRESLDTIIVALFAAVGLSKENASTVADNLLFAERMGIASHGIIRVPYYIEKLLKGGINPKPIVQIVVQKGACALVEGDRGMGQIPGVFAMQQAIKIASTQGIGLVSVRNSNHFGPAGYYSLMADRQDMVGIAASNTAPVMAPTGGRKKMLGNNPIAFSLPSAGPHPVLADMALSVCALGKFLVAAKNGESIPSGAALDSKGNPTEDPTEALKGSALPIGDYKGYALSIVVDALTGVLTGGRYGPDVGSLISGDASKSSGKSFIFAALDPSIFIDISTFKNRISEMTDRLKNSRPADGSAEILIPGEKEFTYKEKCPTGIELNPDVKNELKELAKRLRCTEAEKVIDGGIL